ncbi:MAG: SDR family NAD(P)-dependent oxidoreductase [Acidimicrobiales bacterium]
MTDGDRQIEREGRGRFAGRRAVVTGGGSGIGAAVCRLFAADSATVTVLDRNATSAAALPPRWTGGRWHAMCATAMP